MCDSWQQKTNFNFLQSNRKTSDFHSWQQRLRNEDPERGLRKKILGKVRKILLQNNDHLVNDEKELDQRAEKYEEMLYHIYFSKEEYADLLTLDWHLDFVEQLEIDVATIKAHVNARSELHTCLFSLVNKLGVERNAEISEMLFKYTYALYNRLIYESTNVEFDRPVSDLRSNTLADQLAWVISVLDGECDVSQHLLNSLSPNPQLERQLIDEYPPFKVPFISAEDVVGSEQIIKHVHDSFILEEGGLFTQFNKKLQERQFQKTVIVLNAEGGGEQKSLQKAKSKKPENPHSTPTKKCKTLGKNQLPPQHAENEQKEKSYKKMKKEDTEVPAKAIDAIEENMDYCIECPEESKCPKEDELLCCGKCPRAFHVKCCRQDQKEALDDPDWICFYCKNESASTLFSDLGKQCTTSLELVNCFVMYLLKYNLSTQFRIPVYEHLVNDGLNKLASKYKKKIKKPMDLRTIQTKLNKSAYTHPSEVLCDIELIWKNCQEFNEEGTCIYRMATHLSNLFKRFKNEKSEQLFCSEIGEADTGIKIEESETNSDGSSCCSVDDSDFDIESAPSSSEESEMSDFDDLEYEESGRKRRLRGTKTQEQKCTKQAERSTPNQFTTKPSFPDSNRLTEYCNTSLNCVQKQKPQVLTPNLSEQTFDASKKGIVIHTIPMCNALTSLSHQQTPTWKKLDKLVVAAKAVSVSNASKEEDFKKYFDKDIVKELLQPAA